MHGNQEISDFSWNLIERSNMEELVKDGTITLMLKDCYLGMQTSFDWLWMQTGDLLL
jgi:hypothetical protein